MKKNWLKYIVAYAMWMVFTGVGIFFIIVSRNSVFGLLSLYYVQDKFQRRMEVQFIDKAYLFVVAFAVLILMIVVEEYFKHGAQKGDLAKRILKVFGIEILFMFAASLASAFLVGFSTLIWLILAALFVSGLLMIFISIKLPGVKKQPRSLS